MIQSPCATPVTDLASAAAANPPPRVDTAARVSGRMLAGLGEFAVGLRVVRRRLDGFRFVA
ncbi:MAG: hypothetical protein IPF50_07030 [Proteobacteria bacterium]|nr:hypothetical protein [Pseudomonadota bacterium]